MRFTNRPKSKRIESNLCKLPLQCSEDLGAPAGWYHRLAFATTLRNIKVIEDKKTRPLLRLQNFVRTFVSETNRQHLKGICSHKALPGRYEADKQSKHALEYRKHHRLPYTSKITWTCKGNNGGKTVTVSKNKPDENTVKETLGEGGIAIRRTGLRLGTAKIHGRLQSPIKIITPPP